MVYENDKTFFIHHFFIEKTFYVQYRKVLSVRILAKISPSGKARMISSAAANHEAEVWSDMTPRL